MDRCCGTCIYHKRGNELGEWCCDNEESEYYSLETEYMDECIDYEGKDE